MSVIRLSHLFSRQTDTGQYPACYALMNGTNLYHRREDTPCPNGGTGVSVCCSRADVCTEDGICHFTEPGPKLSGYYTGACTDPTFKDPNCPKQCTQFSSQDIAYNTTSGDWACCYNNLGETVDCGQPVLRATFSATPEPSLTAAGIAPGTPLPPPPPPPPPVTSSSVSSATVSSSSAISSSAVLSSSSSVTSSSLLSSSSTSPSSAASSSSLSSSSAPPSSITTYPPSFYGPTEAVQVPSSSTASGNSVASQQHETANIPAIASVSVIGVLLVLAVILFSILLCRRHSKHKRPNAFENQKQTVPPPDDYQRHLVAQGGANDLYGSNSPPSLYPIGYSPTSQMHYMNNEVNYSKQSMPPYPGRAYESPLYRNPNEPGLHTYYEEEKAFQRRQAMQQKGPLTELDGGEWQMELDGRLRRSTHAKAPLTRMESENWKDKKLPLPVPAAEGEVAKAF